MNQKWTTKQKRILDGLSAIGEEIAGFYEAGLKIFYEGCPNGAYLLIHTAREIDGGLRDILDVDFRPENKDKKTRKDSILFSLGSTEFEGLAEDWFEATGELHKYTHRHGAWKSPRKIEEVKPVWEQYEQILERLVGSYYSIIERIERIGEIKNIEGKGVVDTLVNLLSIPAYSNYFFRNQKDVKWFKPLRRKGLFSPSQIVFNENGNAQFWNVLDYLERVSEQVSENPQYAEELIAIMENIVQFSMKKHLQDTKGINNYHIWWYCVKILINVPSSLISKCLTADKFRLWLIVWLEHSPSDILIHDIGGKLLPSLLTDISNLKHAENIIDLITNIKVVGGSMQGRKEAIMAWDAYQVRDTFKKNSKLIAEKCPSSVIYNVADKLKTALEYKRRSHFTNLIIGEVDYQIEVKRSPLERLTEGEIGFKDGQYECIVKRFAPDQLKDIDRKDSHYFAMRLHDISPQDELAHFSIPAEDRGTFVSKLMEGLPKGIDWKSADKYEERCGNLYDALFLDFSFIPFKSIAESHSDHTNEAEVVLITILRKVLLVKCEINRAEGKEILDAFLSYLYPFPIFRRFALLGADRFWDDYSGLMERFIELTPTALEESHYEVELQDILLHHNQYFSPALLDKLIALTNDVPGYYLKEGERTAAYWRFKWLSPLRDNPKFSGLYKEAKKLAEPKDGKPFEPERTSIKSSWGPGASPFSIKEILEMPVVELVKRLEEFKGSDWWRGAFEGEPTRDGLANALREAAKEVPNHFTNELTAFCAVDYSYLNSVIQGISEAWKSEKEIDWKKVFSFGLEYFAKLPEPFRSEGEKGQGEDWDRGRHNWVINEFVDLIADGCRNDARAYDSRFFDSTEKTLNLIIPHLKGVGRLDNERDALGYTINNSLGRTILAFLSFSLRVVRFTKKKEENWGRNKYERFFSIGIDADILIGWYLPQIMFLDGSYAKEKMTEYAQRGTDDYGWQMFMEGFLCGSSSAVYPHMRPNYLKTVKANISKEKMERRLVEHICIGYLYHDEPLKEKNSEGKESLFWKMLLEAGTLDAQGRWLEAVSFFWSTTGRVVGNKEEPEDERLPEDAKKKIIEFWRWTFAQQETAKRILSDKYNFLLGLLAELTILLDEIDEETERWLLLSAPHIDLNHNAMYFIECLAQFDDDESIKRIGRIYKEALKNSTPTFDQEHIKLIVSRISEKGDENDFLDICNTYGRRGIHFLKPIWEEHQKKKS